MLFAPRDSLLDRAARWAYDEGEWNISRLAGRKMELGRRIKSCRCLAIPQGKALDADYMRAVGERE